MTGMGALQSAIYSLLVGDATLMASVVTVTAVHPQPDDAGDEAEFPYVTIGQDVGDTFDSHTFLGTEVSAQIDVWSRSNNYIEAKTIAARIQALLHHQPLTITGMDHVLTTMESATYLIDPDGRTKRALLVFRVKMTDPNS